jgi:hypothetical protein
MLSFKEWLLSEEKKKRKGKNVKSTNQGSSEVGNVNQQGKVDRNPEAIEYQGVYYFPEP